MMRLIDADALKEKIEQSDGDGAIAKYCKRVLAECLDNDAPTIPAIPVEWLRQYAPEKWSTYMQAAVEIIIEAWQKEQEAQDG